MNRFAGNSVWGPMHHAWAAFLDGNTFSGGASTCTSLNSVEKAYKNILSDDLLERKPLEH